MNKDIWFFYGLSGFVVLAALLLTDPEMGEFVLGSMVAGLAIAANKSHNIHRRQQQAGLGTRRRARRTPHWIP